MADTSIAARVRSLGIRSLPAVVIDGKLARCCSDRGGDMEALRAAGFMAAEPAGSIGVLAL